MWTCTRTFITVYNNPHWTDPNVHQRSLDKQIVVYPYSGILLKNENEQSELLTCSNMEEAQSYIKQKTNQTPKKDILYDCNYMRPTAGKLNCDVRNQIMVWMGYGVHWK